MKYFPKRLKVFEKFDKIFESYNLYVISIADVNIIT